VFAGRNVRGDARIQLGEVLDLVDHAVKQRGGVGNVDRLLDQLKTGIAGTLVLSRALGLRSMQAASFCGDLGIRSAQGQIKLSHIDGDAGGLWLRLGLPLGLSTSLSLSLRLSLRLSATLRLPLTLPWPCPPRPPPFK
jgi:hypothetical protein